MCIITTLNIYYLSKYCVVIDNKSPDSESKHSKNMEYLLNYWNGIINSKGKPGALYTEGGPLNTDDLQGKPICHQR